MQNETENTDYLYDFIYADTRRISSYLSQIDPTGVITAIKEIVGDSDSIDSSGKINLKLFEAAAKGLSTNSQSLERQFDATPTLPWTLLRLLHENGYLSDSLENTPVGRMVLVKGEISLIDLKLLREAWRPLSEQWIIEREAALNNVIKNSDANRTIKEQAKKEMQEFKERIPHERAGISILEKLPHTVNMKHISESGSCWSAISPSNFLFDPDDILLKYGPNMEGIWYLAAIVDAHPMIDNGHPEPAINNNFHDLLIQLSRILQYRFGRPPGYYAVTPIAIYRAVERPQK